MWRIAPCPSLRESGCVSLFGAAEKRIHHELVGSSAGASCSALPGWASSASTEAYFGRMLTQRPGFHSRVERIARAVQRLGRVEGAGKDEAQVDNREEDVGLHILQDWVDGGFAIGEEEEDEEGVDVVVEKQSNNMRKIEAKIEIHAALEDVWALLTDYEGLVDFIPGLAISQLLEKRENGARLYQVGEQEIALGVKFKAKAVVECEEKAPEMHEDWIRRDIDFEMVEGDFHIFKGTWRLVQVGGTSVLSSETLGRTKRNKTILSYIVTVQPKVWLPVALVEGRLTTEVKTNLVSIRDKARGNKPE